jgi:hypothetical protein
MICANRKLPRTRVLSPWKASMMSLLSEARATKNMKSLLGFEIGLRIQIKPKLIE